MAAIPDTAHALQAHLEGYKGGDELDTKLVETFKAQLTGNTAKPSRADCK